MLGVDLDRFSRPLASETIKFEDDVASYEVEEVILCKGCGHVLYEEDDTIQSKYWDDDFLHNDKECINKYYDKEKSPFAANKRAG